MMYSKGEDYTQLPACGIVMSRYSEKTSPQGQQQKSMVKMDRYTLFMSGSTGLEPSYDPHKGTGKNTVQCTYTSVYYRHTDLRPW